MRLQSRYVRAIVIQRLDCGWVIWFSADSWDRQEASVPHYRNLSVGLLTIWQLASPEMNVQRERERHTHRSCNIFYNPISDEKNHHVHHILLATYPGTIVVWSPWGIDHGGLSWRLTTTRDKHGLHLQRTLRNNFLRLKEAMSLLRYKA